MGTRPPRGEPVDRAELLTALGVTLDAELLVLALTHRSYAYEHGGLPPNERLEFLGDAVLGVVVTDRLYREHPDLPEGQLAKLRASVVNMHALARVARQLGNGGLGSYLLLGRGEELTGGRDKASILADGLEAVIGAVYLEHGIETARELVHRLFATLLAEAPLRGAGLDWKTSLQELTAAASLGVPEYQVDEQGPDHRKEFTATVIVAGRGYGNGDGTTKKEAEQKAAEAAYRTLEQQMPPRQPEAVDAAAEAAEIAEAAEVALDAGATNGQVTHDSVTENGITENDATENDITEADSGEAQGSAETPAG